MTTILRSLALLGAGLAAACGRFGFDHAGQLLDDRATATPVDQTTAMQVPGNLDHGAHANFPASIATGRYVGNGQPGRSITGLGFAPLVVLIKVDHQDPAATALSSVAVLRTATMIGDQSKASGDSALRAGLVVSLDADGFSIGADLRVNGEAGACGGECRYYWMAVGAQPGLRVGTYVGNGATRSVSDIGLRPDWLVVISSGAARMVQRSRGEQLELERTFGAAVRGRDLVTLDDDGFTVDASPRTNEQGTIYHYVAWQAEPGRMACGSYQGDDRGHRLIGGIGFAPVFVLVRPVNRAAESTFRMKGMPSGASLTMKQPMRPNLIEELEPDGFRLGTDALVNQARRDDCLPDRLCRYCFVALGQTRRSAQGSGMERP